MNKSSKPPKANNPPPRPYEVLAQYLRKFVDKNGKPLMNHQSALVMVNDGRLPAYRSMGVYIVRANEKFPLGSTSPEGRVKLEDPEYITLYEWGVRHWEALGYASEQEAKDNVRDSVHDWRKRGQLADAQLYQSGRVWLIHKDTPIPVGNGRGRRTQGANAAQPATT